MVEKLYQATLALFFVSWIVLALMLVNLGPGVWMFEGQTSLYVAYGLSLLILAAMFLKNQRKIENIVEDHQIATHCDFEDLSWYLKEIVSQKKRPMVELEWTASKVALAAADLIRGSVKSRQLGGYNLLFFGAAGLQTVKDADYVPVGEDELSPGQIYHGALEEVASKSLPIGRFVSLLTHEEYVSRSPEVRETYVQWLDAQKAQMKRNPNFVLLDSKRAPKWGATGASVLTSECMIQFSHANGAAVILYDDRLVSDFILKTIGSINNSLSANLRVYVKSSNGGDESKYDLLSLELFEKFIKETRDWSS